MISLKNETPLHHSHSKHLSQIKCAENVHTESKSVKSVSKVLRNHSKIINDRYPSFKDHEFLIYLLHDPGISEKIAIQTLSNRINSLTEPINEFIDKLVQGQVSRVPQV